MRQYLIVSVAIVIVLALVVCIASKVFGGPSPDSEELTSNTTTSEILMKNSTNTSPPENLMYPIWAEVDNSLRPSYSNDNRMTNTTSQSNTTTQEPASKVPTLGYDNYAELCPDEYLANRDGGFSGIIVVPKRNPSVCRSEQMVFINGRCRPLSSSRVKNVTPHATTITTSTTTTSESDSGVVLMCS